MAGQLQCLCFVRICIDLDASVKNTVQQYIYIYTDRYLIQDSVASITWIYFVIVTFVCFFFALKLSLAVLVNEYDKHRQSAYKYQSIKSPISNNNSTPLRGGQLAVMAKHSQKNVDIRKTPTRTGKQDLKTSNMKDTPKSGFSGSIGNLFSYQNTPFRSQMLVLYIVL